MKALIPPPYNGAAAQFVIERYFILLHVCGAIAILHTVAERLYSGRMTGRLTMGVLLVLFCLGLIGGFGLQPKLRALHIQKYRGATPELREQAATSFTRWHITSRIIDLMMFPGLVFYFWQVTNMTQASRTIMSRRNWAGLS